MSAPFSWVQGDYLECRGHGNFSCWGSPVGVDGPRVGGGMGVGGGTAAF